MRSMKHMTMAIIVTRNGEVDGALGGQLIRVLLLNCIANKWTKKKEVVFYLLDEFRIISFCDHFRCLWICWFRMLAQSGSTVADVSGKGMWYKQHNQRHSSSHITHHFESFENLMCTQLWFNLLIIRITCDEPGGCRSHLDAMSKRSMWLNRLSTFWYQRLFLNYIMNIGELVGWQTRRR